MAFPSNETEFQTYYADLLIAQYKTKPLARATIKVLADLATMPQGGNFLTDQNGNALTDVNGTYLTDNPNGAPIMPLALANAFDVTTATGQQLQWIAQLVGCVNSGYNLSGQFVTLTDTQFGLLIQAKGALNRLRGTNAQIQNFIFKYFAGVLRVSNDLNMNMTYTFLVPLNSLQWVELFISQGFLPVPLGVNMGPVIRGGDYFAYVTSLNTVANAWQKPFCTSTAVVSSSNPILTSTDTV